MKNYTKCQIFVTKHQGRASRPLQNTENLHFSLNCMHLYRVSLHSATILQHLSHSGPTLSIGIVTPMKLCGLAISHALQPAMLDDMNVIFFPQDEQEQHNDKEFHKTQPLLYHLMNLRKVSWVKP